MATTHIQRNEPKPYSNPVKLLIGIPPFQLMLTLAGIEISREYITTKMSTSHLAAEETLKEWEVLFQSYTEFTVQLDHNHDHIGIPVLACYLSLCQLDREGLRLRFSFHEEHPDLTHLIQQESTHIF